MQPGQTPNGSKQTPSQPQDQPATTVPAPVLQTQQPAFRPLQPVVSQPSTATVPDGSKGLNKVLIFGGIGSILLIAVAILVIGWMFMWSPAAQSKRLSGAFMHAITNGDVDNAVALTGDSSSRPAMNSARTAIHGSYELHGSSFKDGTGYYLYDITGADKKYARTIIQTENGKRIVHSLVYSNMTLALIPSTGKSNTENTAVQGTASTQTASCVVKSDFYALENATNGGNGSETTDYANIDKRYPAYFTLVTYFLGDQTAFDTQDDLAGYTNDSKLKALGDFYKANSTKAFTIHLYGVVASSEPRYSTLADQRAQKIKADLLGYGVPAKNIVVDRSQNIATVSGGVYAGEQNNPQAQRASRSVWIEVRPDPTCAA